MARLLVTGATGFIGRHLLRRLRADGYDVVGATRRAPQELENGVRWVQVSAIDGQTDWSLALRGVTKIIHLAGLAHQFGRDARAQRDAFYRVNVEGVRSLALAAASRGTVDRFLSVSSIAVHGSSSDHALTEQSPTNPDTHYGKSKLLGEQAVREELGDEVGWTIFRPPLVYGRGDPGNLARLARLMRRSLPLPLAAIHNRRSFIYVENLVDALAGALAHPNAANETFVVTDGEVFSTPDLLCRIGHATGLPVRLAPIPVPVLRLLGRFGDGASAILRRSFPLDSYAVDRLVGSLWINDRKIRRMLEWAPPYTMDAGLRQTLAITDQLA